MHRQRAYAQSEVLRTVRGLMHSQRAYTQSDG